MENVRGGRLSLTHVETNETVVFTARMATALPLITVFNLDDDIIQVNLLHVAKGATIDAFSTVYRNTLGNMGATRIEAQSLASAFTFAEGDRLVITTTSSKTRLVVACYGQTANIAEPQQ